MLKWYNKIIWCYFWLFLYSCSIQRVTQQSIESHRVPFHLLWTLVKLLISFSWIKLIYDINKMGWCLESPNCLRQTELSYNLFYDFLDLWIQLSKASHKISSSSVSCFDLSLYLMIFQTRRTSSQQKWQLRWFCPSSIAASQPRQSRLMFTGKKKNWIYFCWFNQEQIYAQSVISKWLNFQEQNDNKKNHTQ